MLGYFAGAFVWGLAKAVGSDATRSHNSLEGFGAAELVEELQFRTGIERMGLRRVFPPGTARVLSAVAFASIHPGHELDAALGGILYSHAYDKGGLLGSTVAHLCHNLGVYLGARP